MSSSSSSSVSLNDLSRDINKSLKSISKYSLDSLNKINTKLQAIAVDQKNNKEALEKCRREHQECLEKLNSYSSDSSELLYDDDEETYVEPVVKKKKRRIQPQPVSQSGNNISGLFGESTQQMADNPKNDGQTKAIFNVAKKIAEKNTMEDNNPEYAIDLNFAQGYAFKSLGHRGETIEQWFSRILAAVNENEKVFNTLSGLKTVVEKMKKRRDFSGQNGEKLKSLMSNEVVNARIVLNTIATFKKKEKRSVSLKKNNGMKLKF